MLFRRTYLILILLLVANSRAPGAAPHWAFQPISSAPPNTTIDSLITRRLRAVDLEPQPTASKEHLLRRVHLDLTGLAPTTAELNEFLTDVSPDAYERVVDRLLASPHYGERWGRHWMDIWRYSDGYGLGKQLRYSSHHLWHWRDWIVNSLNADKGYDRMILEMLAGDELAPTDPDVIAGTGFLARNYYLFNRTTWLDNTIEHTGKAFLGMTFNCVKCHEHKYDPFEHEDYYRLRAIFEPHQVRLDPVPGELNFDRDGLPRVFDDHLEAVTHLHVKGDDKQPDKSRTIEPGIPALFGKLQVAPVKLPTFAFAPGTRDHVRESALTSAKDELQKAESRLHKAKQTDNNASTPGRLIFHDDFSKTRPDLWHSSGPDWRHQDGHLIRHTAGRNDNLRSKFTHPENFTATLRYRTTGGATYKSVGIRFDVSPDAKNAHMVYTSAHKPAPKLQVAHIRNGKSNYPAAGRISRKITTNRLYELEIKVRDQLLNVCLDGEFLLAYALPNRRPPGRIELTAFDATVEFHSFKLRELPAGADLDPVGATSRKHTDPAQELKLAKLDHKRRQLALASLQARIAADQARLDRPQTDAEGKARNAAKAEALTAIAEAEYQLATLNDKATDTKKKRNEYQASLNKARTRLNNPGSDYTPLTGSRKALETPEHKVADYAPVHPRTSTGRRLAFARWIAGEQNPLTARVAVNHIWMRHFGTPLVESVFDFGLRTPEPLHRDLLDLLAARFIAADWSMKALHKRILLSAAYRRSSSNLDADSETLRRDPENRHYWRMNPRRMESQLIRDNLLHLAGALDSTLGGPSLPVDKPSQRRSLYFRHSRDDANPFVNQFDDADFLQCYRRAESIVPQQALALANSKLTSETARRLAQSIKAESDETFITALFIRILTRHPDQEELSACKALLKETNDNRQLLAHSLLNHNDFITIR